jgi:hypothetical protein
MPYIYPLAAQLNGQALVGDGQCVTLVRQYAPVPHSSTWREGERVLGNRRLAVGTAIATFENGKYAGRASGNHSAFYLGQIRGGIWVVDQWPGKPKREVSRRFIRVKPVLPNGRFADPSNNAAAFSVIE